MANPFQRCLVPQLEQVTDEANTTDHHCEAQAHHAQEHRLGKINHGGYSLEMP
jgi:hypothetical protein